MKKLIIGLFVFSFLIIGAQVYASEVGCLTGQVYSSTTGQQCGCSNSEVYSSTTGQACTEQKFTGYLSLQGPTTTMWGTHIITIDTGIRCVTTPCPASKSYSVGAGSSSVLSDLNRYKNSQVIISGKLSYYNLEGGFWGIVASKVIPLSTTLPVISGISGPQTLNVNQTGTWTVSASDSSGGNLSYSVNWGDVYYATSVVQPSISIQQSATFTHSYSLAETYTPIFTVTNESGQSATTSLSVKVSVLPVDEGCLSGFKYSSTTGRACPVTNDGCLPGYNYSPITGQKCLIATRACFLDAKICPNGSSVGRSGPNCEFVCPITSIQRTLRVGTTGEDVKTLQAFLGVTADGSFGPITQAKVMEWQAENGLTPDGIFGPISIQKANLAE